MAQEAPPERVSVEFRVENDRYPFVGASASESCAFELEEMIPRGDGVYSEFFRVRGADADRILTLAEETPQVEPTLLSVDGDECLFEFEVAGGCIAVSLAERGARPGVVRSDDGDATVVADVPSDRARTLVRDVLDEHSGVDVQGEDGDAALRSGVDKGTVHAAVHEALSPRQRGVLLTALSEGFYEWPRRATLADVAATLGTDEAALDAQLRNCEQLVLAALFEDGTLGGDAPAHPFSATEPTGEE